MVMNLLLAQYTAKKRINITRTQMRDEGKLYATTVSGIEMIETIKSSGAEDGFFERWAGYHAAVNKSKTSFAKVEKILGSVPLFLQQISAILILTVGAWLVMQGEFTIGMLLAFQTFMVQLLQPVSELISAGQSIQEMRTATERIEDVMKYDTDVSDDISLPDENDEGAAKLTGQIEMENITFGYSKLSPPLVTDFSMTLKQGSKVAFVGSSGCGKSTLVKLLSGLYPPWEGEVRFDGKPVKEIRHDIFTASVAVVDQDIILFEDTVSNNIKMWDESIEDFEVILAARDVQIHEDIMMRENGYDALLTEGGRNFSGGQRQRMEIARVLAQDPTIIILDEATSALDAKTEFQVMQAIRDRNITCIVVAHRLSTIRDCDEIIVMDRGNIVERGHHEDLMKKGGLYTTLITTE
jgi:ABC-type bacteriocin/lantibiotic exporter with double-glycine peptidase domain